MPDLSYRSRQRELLDQPVLDQEEIFRNLHELDRINALLGGHAATLKGLNELIKNPSRTYHIVDYACGGGDTLRKIYKWGQTKGLDLKLTGFDLLPQAIEYATKHSEEYPINYQIADFMDFQTEDPVDIACCALVCHHFYDDDLHAFLQKMRAQARLGVVINDLHRHPFAYYSIKWLTALLSNSRYVKNDAPLSVWRGFKKQEWQSILNSAGFSNYQINWVWAFRHLILEKKEQND